MNKLLATKIFTFLSDNWLILLQKNIVASSIKKDGYDIYPQGIILGGIEDPVIPFSEIESKWDDILQAMYDHIKDYVELISVDNTVDIIHERFDSIKYQDEIKKKEADKLKKEEALRVREEAARLYKERVFWGDLP